MENKKLKVVFAGGGTGGHIYPAIAIAGGIKNVYPDAEITFIGTQKGLEKDIVPHAGYPIKFISVVGMERKISLKLLSTVKEGFVGVGQALKLLKKLKPDIVVGTGGYVSGPVVLSAALLNIPTVVHEQNAYPGVTNKILNPIVSKVLLTFPEAKDRFRRKGNLVLTGLPVRKEIINVTRQEAIKELGIPENSFVVAVVGGSRGARSINSAMVDVHSYMRNHKDAYILHVTGEYDYADTIERIKACGITPHKNLDIRPYMHNIKYALAAADLIVGRAGASFLSEILVKGIPSILVPYPFAAENHQHWNALSLENAGAAKIIDDKNLEGQVLLNTILEIMQDKVKRNAMQDAAMKLAKPDALEKIVKEIFELINVANN